MSFEITLICFGILAVVVGYELNQYKAKRPDAKRPDEALSKPHGSLPV